MEAREILRVKRDGGELSSEAVRAFFDGYLDERIPDESAAALLTAIFIHGMGEEELFHWTEAMLRSGETLAWDGLDGPVVDKHSTGGIGDKVSIPLAPALAACGVHVPMVSGRGLGHTGGTLDKLESIPGFATDLDPARLTDQVRRIGCAFGAQTRTLVPADMRLYALRDRVGLVASIPLIASSILSKKLAEGLDALVLDVKYGSGAFLTDVARGEQLARTMIDLAARFGLRASAFHTAMDRPLGRAVGHALEIEESLACLAGDGPPDLTELVTTFGGSLLAQVGRCGDEREGRERIAAVLADGSAREVFARVIEAQGGDARVVDDPRRLPRVSGRAVFSASRAGHVDFVDARKVGLAVLALGGGRERAGDEVDPAVGVRWRVSRGHAVAAGDALAEIHHRDGRGLERALALLAEALRVTDARPEPTPLVRARFTGGESA